MKTLISHYYRHLTLKPHHITFGLFAIVLGFYLYTLAPSVTWADGARMQMDVLMGGSTYWFYEEASHIPTDGYPFDHLGVAAWDHPLYVMLGQLFVILPWGNPPQRVTLMSALAGALAVGLVYRLGWSLVSDHWAAALGALALAVCHTFWFNAVTPEVFTLNIVFVIGFLWIAIRWPEAGGWRQLALFAFLAGLGLANHLMIGLTIVIAVLYMFVMTVTTANNPAKTGGPLSPERYAVWIEAFRGWRGPVIIGLFLVGFAPWWIQLLRAARVVNILVILEVAIGFPWVGLRLTAPSGWLVFTNLVSYLGWLFYQFTPVGVALGLYGFFFIRRERPYLAWFLLAIFISHILFWASYSVPDRFNYYLPTYLVFVLAIMWGIARVRSKLAGWRRSNQIWPIIGVYVLSTVLTVLTPIALYRMTPSTLQQMGMSESTFGIQPIGTGVRDTLGYFLNPDKRGDDSAARFGRTTFARLAPDALVLTPKTSDLEAYIVLRYFQLVEKMRPDVRLNLLMFEPVGDDMSRAVLTKVYQQSGCRPLYLASLHPESYPLAALRRDFEIVAEANLYRLLPYRPPPAASGCPEPDWTGITGEELIIRAMRWK